MFRKAQYQAILEETIRNTLKAKCVGIAGAGGLGSNCAVALARIGIGKLIIADFDVVSVGNLNRQYYFLDQVGMYKVDALKENIRRIDPAVLVEVHNIRLDPDAMVRIFAACDVLVEAFDLAEMKQMIAETAAIHFPGKPLVMGLGMAGWGNSNDMRVTYQENLIICGDGISEISNDMPPLAPRVGICANMQANETINYLLIE